MIVCNNGTYVLLLNVVEDTRLDGYTIQCIQTRPRNSWINVIPIATPHVIAEKIKPQYEPSEDNEEQIGTPNIDMHNTSSEAPEYL